MPFGIRQEDCFMFIFYSSKHSLYSHFSSNSLFVSQLYEVNPSRYALVIQSSLRLTSQITLASMYVIHDVFFINNAFVFDATYQNKFNIKALGLQFKEAYL